MKKLYAAIAGNERSDLLRDPEGIMEYLDASMALALSENSFAGLFAGLRKVAEVNGGMMLLADKAGIDLGSLEKLLSTKNNQDLRTVIALLRVFNLRLALKPITSDDLGFVSSAVALPIDVDFQQLSKVLPQE